MIATRMSERGLASRWPALVRAATARSRCRHSPAARPLAVVVLATLLVAGGPLRPALAGPRIVNGDLTSAWPTTGALLHNPSGPISQLSATSWCSGTLIGCSTFLTAAHCVEDSTVANRYLVFLQHAGFFAVSSIVIHPSYTTNNWPKFDVAVIHLASAVDGIRPTPINTTNPTSFIPEAGTIVGFGRSGATDGGDDYGLKRVGDIQTLNCPSGLGGTNNDLVCWQYNGGVRGDTSNTCNGDSGGPLFMNLGAGMRVAGVTSGGSSNECGPGDVSYDANVATFSAWIDGEGGADLDNTACGGGAQVEDAEVTVLPFSGSLSSAVPSQTNSFTVGASTQRLVVTMNASEKNSPNFDLYVRFGSAPTTSVYDCAAVGSSQYGACEFDLPAAGTWYAMVRRSSGSERYQATATIFSGDPPVCGDNVRAGSEACDGSDDGACPGQCQPGCTCPAPVCGNSVREGSEICDGTDDGACAGLCQPACTCPAPVCGNGVIEGSESCEVGDDSACPGECNEATCACTTAGSCTATDLYPYRLSTYGGKVKLSADLDNSLGNYDGLDPSTGGFSLFLDDGNGSIDVTIPGGLGWESSNPLKGNYKWKGDLSGIRRVKLRDLSSTNGLWSIKVNGKDVPGAAEIDPIVFYVDVEVTIDGVCSAGVY